jgi:hypothetical protein
MKIHLSCLTPAVIALSFFISGCATHVPVPVRTDMHVILKSPVDHENPRVLGTATYLRSINTCIITLREYPVCLLHEIRHCFEGQWHPGRDTDEDC